MDVSDDHPQLGHADVDRAAIQQPGVVLHALAAEIGARVDEASAEGAPPDGWRVLKRHQSGQVLIGAPVDAEATVWRVAHVQPVSSDATVRVHPETMTLRPSRAQRRQGLALRWPTLMQGASGNDGFAVDIVNTGSHRWIPNGDGFHVVGVFAEPGETAFHFGWADSAQRTAVPLDPGEYARVSVAIMPNAWERLEPGAHDLHAVLVSLGVRTETALNVHVSREVLGSHRQQRRSQPTPDDRRRAVDEEVARVRGVLAAAGAFAEVTAAIAASNTDEDAVARLGELLNLGEAAAEVIYNSTLRQLRPGNAAQFYRRLDELHRHREAI
ncbi:hypothetical protein ACI3KX_05920 [Microbacterium sp. ZW CA_36]|uniref:hypothetical protein n=1 Tax=Microbacterium sp. ZW CA_36 TaxID=3378078 RepID=UPI0038542D38